jgi:hypothetical protein
MEPNANVGPLDLPLVGRDWIIWLPLEQWANLVQHCTEAVETLGMSGNQGDTVEQLDKALQQALAVATALPPADMKPE